MLVNPLTLTEVLHRLGEFMDQPSLASSIQVSRTWHRTLEPWFWTDLSFSLSKVIPRRPRLLSFKKNVDLIQRLEILFENSVVFSHVYDPPVYPMCPSLTTLIPKQSSWASDNSVAVLIQKLQGILRHLSYSLSLYQQVPDAFWNSLVSCAYLERLEIDGLWFPCQRRFLSLKRTLWSRLHVLEFKASWQRDELHHEDEGPLNHFVPDEFDENEDVQEWLFESFNQPVLPTPIAVSISHTPLLPPPSQIRDLTLESRHLNQQKLETQFRFIESCPNLERLCWTVGYQWNSKIELFSPMHMLARSLFFGTGFQRSESIHLSDQRFHLRDWTILVRTMNRITELDLSGSNFDDGCWRMLREQASRHLSTIRKVNLMNCGLLSGFAILKMLENMSNLVTFKAGTVDETDLGGYSPSKNKGGNIGSRCDSKSWKCTELKDLSLTISLDSRFSQHLVLSRLSELRLLERCTIYSTDGNLEMTLESGLDQLRSLGGLRSFQIQYRGGYRALWKEAEIEWMQKHWRCLEGPESMKSSLSNGMK